MTLTDPVSPDLKRHLRTLKLGQLLHTLPERLTLARSRTCRTPTSSSSCSPTRSPAGRTAPPPAAPAPPASTPTCGSTPGTPPPRSATTSSYGTSSSPCGSPKPPTAP